MFTIKLYQDAGRQKIMAAESFTILRGGDNPSEAEISLHQKNRLMLLNSIFSQIKTKKERSFGKIAIFARVIIFCAFIMFFECAATKGAKAT